MSVVGLSGNIAKAAKDLETLGIIPMVPGVQTFRRSFHARVDVANTNSRITFFDQPESGFTTNLPGGGNGLPANSVFFIQQMKIKVSHGYTVAGAINAGGELVADGLAPANLIEDALAVIENGRVNLDVGDTRVVDDVHGLENFAYPSADFAAAVSVDNSAAPKLHSMVALRNGHSSDDNGYAFRPWFRVDPNRSIRGYIDWPISRTLQSPIVLKMQLDGTFLTTERS